MAVERLGFPEGVLDCPDEDLDIPDEALDFVLGWYLVQFHCLKWRL